nr:hypothetical protein [Acetobacter malorum]
MKQSDFPTRLATPIADSAAASDIATIPTTQAHSGDGTASLALGFPPETFIARSAGGGAPARAGYERPAQPDFQNPACLSGRMLGNV